MNLLIVESPIQARRITTFLPDIWRVEATHGHVRDLPVDTLGIDLQHDFAVQYRVVADHFGTLQRLQRAAREADAIYLGTTPDREGETIAFHVTELLKEELKGKALYRITFSTVTPTAVLHAIENPRQIDPRLVEAQQTRRTLDRLVGYLLSPLASRMLKAPHSVGRVQMAALWLLAAREVAIQSFKVSPYWTLAATFKLEDGASFSASLSAAHAHHSDQWSRPTVYQVADGLRSGYAYVQDVTTQTENRPPLPPFTTASLLQAACETLHLAPECVMALANRLYEQGLITHSRTASVYVPSNAQESARAYIAEKFGAAYVPLLPQVYISKDQEAHEAIRPTDLAHSPETMPSGEGAALYALIWRRFLASQMADAQEEVQAITLQVGQESDERFDAFLTARTNRYTFDGFHKISGETPELDTAIPSVSIGQALRPASITALQHMSQPPSLYTASTLIEALDLHGVGRPATFASTLKLLTDKGYLTCQGGALVLTAQAKTLCPFLARHFLEVFVADFTADLEHQLDEIAVGKTTRLEVLRAFWQTFTRSYSPLAAVFLRDDAPPSLETLAALGICPKCGGKLVARRTKTGRQFAGCEHFPKCKGRARTVLFAAAPKAGG